MSSKIALSFPALLIVAGLISSAQGQLSPRVNLPGSSGRVTGIYVDYNETQYIDLQTRFQAFLGIPYAEPPVGDLRFEKPVKKGGLGFAYLAITDKPVCPQISPLDDIIPTNPLIGRPVDEDCLYLSVYAPDPRPSNAPVVVWIHGGGYSLMSGSSPLSEPYPLLAVSPDIVIVSINYRLGVFGFLTTGDENAPGNYGMFDQVMALEWVRDNIEAFGGDPNQVTIMGESAGAASVGLHLLSPLSSGLFHQTIMESGNALGPWAVDLDMDRQKGFTQEIAEIFDCEIETSEVLIDCLRGVTEPNLTRAQLLLTIKYLYNDLLFTPVVDNDFLTDIPIELVKRNEFASVPTLAGTNKDEGSLIALRAYPSYLLRSYPPHMSLEDFRRKLPDYLYWNDPMVVTAAEQWYIDWTQADNASASQLGAFINVNTDQMFACPTEVMVRALQGAGAPVYRYEMTHAPNWSIFVGVPGWLGAGHAEELQFVFGWGLNPANVISRLVDQTEEEVIMSLQFIRYWTNFIKTGNPNGPLTTGEYPDWPLYTLPDQEHKMLSPSMENGRAVRVDTCSFWLNYVPALYQKTEVEDLYDQWQESYEQWRDVNLPEWNDVFDEYKEGCPAP